MSSLDIPIFRPPVSQIRQSIIFTFDTFPKCFNYKTSIEFYN